MKKLALKKLAWQIPLALAAVLGAAQFGPSAVRWLHIRQVLAATTFSPIYVTLAYTDPNTGIEVASDFEGYRSDGAWVKGHYLKRPDGKVYSPHGFILPSTGIGVEVLPEVQGTHTRYYPADHLGRYRLGRPDSAKNCTAPITGTGWPTTVVGTDSILGYQAVHVRSETPKHDNMPGVVQDHWYLADYQCIEVKYIFQRVGEPTPYGSRTAIAISPSDPPPELFVVPTGYMEQTPSESDKAFAGKFTAGVVGSCIRDRWAQLDSWYQKTRRSSLPRGTFPKAAP